MRTVCVRKGRFMYVIGGSMNVIIWRDQSVLIDSRIRVNGQVKSVFTELERERNVYEYQREYNGPYYKGRIQFKSLILDHYHQFDSK